MKKYFSQSKTFALKGKDLKRDWWLVDVSKTSTKNLGRLATQIARTLRGKNKPTFSANLDCGDNVILINADQIQVTGDKADQKLYYRHTGYIGHLKSRTYKEEFERDPCFVIRKAVHGMITRSALRNHIMRHFYTYAGDVHPHLGQTPKNMEI
jgi:large subunit ribosomal protein L13